MRARTAEDDSTRPKSTTTNSWVPQRSRPRSSEPVRPHVQELSFNGSWAALPAEQVVHAQQQLPQPSHQAQAAESQVQQQGETCAGGARPPDSTGDEHDITCLLQQGSRISQQQQGTVIEAHEQHTASASRSCTHNVTVSGAALGVGIAAEAAAEMKQHQLSRSPRQQQQASRQRQRHSRQQSQQQPQHAAQQQQLLLPPLCSQSCSVPTDLEVMDQLLDELVLLDPKISKALASAPRVQFETFRPAAEGPATSRSARGDNGADDNNRTFLTACSVPDTVSNSQEQQQQSTALAGSCSFLPVCAGTAAEPRLTPRQQQQQQLPGALLQQPEVACSTDLFDYSTRAAAAGSYGAKGRTRLHSMNMSAEVDASSFSGAAGSLNGGRGHRARSQHNSIAGASAEAAALGASAAVAQFLASQQHPLATTAGPACLQQQAGEQVTPSMHALQYQMEHIRQLHLDGVRTPAAAGCRGSLGQQQQQSLPAVPGQGGSGANMRAVSTPLTQRQRQNLWADFPVLKPSSQDAKACAASGSSISMRSSGPYAWRRG